MDFRIYRSILGPFMETFATYHYNVPCHNLICHEKLKEVSKNTRTENAGAENERDINNLDTFPFYHDFKYETDSCTVLYPGWTKTDKAYDYVYRKLLWYKKLALYMPKDYKRSMRWLQRQKSLDPEKMDTKLWKFLQWLSFEKDDEFIGNYNWLYTGGNIVGFTYNQEYWLISPDEFRQSPFLCITKLDAAFNPLWKSNSTPMRINLHHKQPVYQIISKPRTEDVILAVRQKDWISIKKLNNDCEVMDIWDIKTFNRHSFTNYFTTCDLSQNCRYLTLVNNAFHVVVFDIEREKPIFSCEQSKEFMQWTRVLFNNDASQVYFADNDSLKIFDLKAKSEPCFIYKPTAVVSRCEKILNFFGSEGRENIFYIATTHNMIEMDIRTGKNLQRWTHMMKCAPQFGGTIRRSDEELVLLQSHNMHELIGIQNEGLNDKFAYSRTSPYLFSTAKQELKKARLNGSGLHDRTIQRFNFKLTGLHVATSSDGIYTVFTVNGGGDVVMTKLKDKKPDDSENDMDYSISSNSRRSFKKFEKHCCDLQTDKCEYRTTPPSTFNLGSILGALENVNIKEMCRRKRFKSFSHYWPNSEIYTPEYEWGLRGGFYDRFLPYWGIQLKSAEDENEENISDHEDGDEKILESKAKVVDWMKSDEK